MNRSFQHYSPELKQRVVEELEAGRLTLREAVRRANGKVVTRHAKSYASPRAVNAT